MSSSSLVSEPGSARWWWARAAPPVFAFFEGAQVEPGSIPSEAVGMKRFFCCARAMGGTRWQAGTTSSFAADLNMSRFGRGRAATGIAGLRPAGAGARRSNPSRLLRHGRGATPRRKLLYSLPGNRLCAACARV